MFQKFRQMMRDHEAMNIVRNGHGDVELIFVVVGGGLGIPPTYGYECNLYQGRVRHFEADPAEAVIGALKRFREKGGVGVDPTPG